MTQRIPIFVVCWLADTCTLHSRSETVNYIMVLNSALNQKYIPGNFDSHPPIPCNSIATACIAGGVGKYICGFCLKTAHDIIISKDLRNDWNERVLTRQSISQCNHTLAYSTRVVQYSSFIMHQNSIDTHAILMHNSCHNNIPITFFWRSRTIFEKPRGVFIGTRYPICRLFNDYGIQ